MRFVLRQLIFVAAASFLALVSMAMLLEPSINGIALEGDPGGILVFAIGLIGLGLSGAAFITRLVTEGAGGQIVLGSGYGCLFLIWILIWGVLPVLQA